MVRPSWRHEESVNYNRQTFKEAVAKLGYMLGTPSIRRYSFVSYLSSRVMT